MGLVKPLFYFLSTHILMTILCYGANAIFPLIPAQIKVAGTIGLCTGVALLGFLYSALFIPAHVKKTTYFMAVFFFLVTCFDNISLLDFFLRPNDIFVSNYFGVGDPFIVNSWAETMMLMEGSLPTLVNFCSFYRMFNGLSWRELALFTLAVMFGFMPTFMIPFLAPEASQFSPLLNISHTCHPFLLFILINLELTLEIPRSLDFDAVEGQGKSEKNGQVIENGNKENAEDEDEDEKPCAPTPLKSFMGFLIKFLSFLLTMATIAIFILELLVAHNQNGQLNRLTGLKLKFPCYFLNLNLKRINPMLLFEPIPAIPIPFGVIHIWLYMVLVFPTLLLNLFLIFRKSGPISGFLWDMNFVAAGTLYCGQFYFLFGPFHPKTPQEFQADPANPIFWLFNLLPFVTSVVNILAFPRFGSNSGMRTSVTSFAIPVPVLNGGEEKNGVKKHQ